MFHILTKVNLFSQLYLLDKLSIHGSWINQIKIQFWLT